MRAIQVLINAIGKLIFTTILLFLIAFIMFVAYKGNQPMQVPDAPHGLTYFEFMEDRLEAARIVKPSRCGWGMMVSLATVGSLYSILYTEIGIHPDGILSHAVASDPNIPNGVNGANWWEVPDIWWKTFEKISWTMLGKPAWNGCQFKPIE